MKHKLFTILILCLISIQTFAQPDRGSFELGGSGNYSSVNSTDEKKIKTFLLNTHVSYFIFKHFSAGFKVSYIGYKESNTINNLTAGPTLEAYLLNRNNFGISVKTGVNFVLKNNMYPQSKDYASFIIGPKVAWNITQNLSTFLWLSYRNSENADDFTQIGSTFPSDNFDVRWGFSYYLHRKGTENN
ncbi:outer membrane beta-barrel protein [Maribellus sediminis]|uniref:outer membrane beta-barrel protein n=1 Tax=Maribellus sediminis TaxID=2696285 RepID=UPI00142FA421|nr:outer membrane beta-barrel protein [Maribellus sediminis]